MCLESMVRILESECFDMGFDCDSKKVCDGYKVDIKHPLYGLVTVNLTEGDSYKVDIEDGLAVYKDFLIMKNDLLSI